MQLHRLASDVTTTPGSSDPKSIRVEIGDAAADLDQRLSAELDRFNGVATPGIASQCELTVRVFDARNNLLAGLSG
jgi:hypothetical protein